MRFELTTSSMPFKKYQSLAGIFTRNKRLSTRPRGLRWTPRDAFWGVWTPRGLQDSTHGLARGVLSCARGCGLLYLLSAEGDNNQFPYKDDAHVELLARQLVRQPQRLGACRPAGGVAGSILTSVLASSVCAGHGSRSKISPVPARPPTQIPSAVSKTSRTLHVRFLHSGGTIFYRRG